MTLFDILILYVAFRAKQLVCDFFLQTSWIALTKGAPFREGGAKALFTHAGIHAAGTLIVTLLLAPVFWWLSIADFVIHAAVDKTKALITNKHKWGYEHTFYWWSLGIDQEAHNLTHLIYIVMIVSAAQPVL